MIAICFKPCLVFDAPRLHEMGITFKREARRREVIATVRNLTVSTAIHKRRVLFLVRYRMGGSDGV